MDGDEVDSFWCFAGVMETAGALFDQDQAGMSTQLDMLASVLSVVEDAFARYLKRCVDSSVGCPIHASLVRSVDAINCYFAYRWLLVSKKLARPAYSARTLCVVLV